jgi:hypothetical protein
MDDPLRLDKQHSIQNLALRLASFKYDPFGRRIGSDRMFLNVLLLSQAHF